MIARSEIRAPVTAAQRVPVAVDTGGEWDRELIAQGFRIARPTAWIIDQTSLSLNDLDAAALLHKVNNASGVYSAVAFTLTRSRQVADIVLRSHSCNSCRPVNWLKGYGWSAELCSGLSWGAGRVRDGLLRQHEALERMILVSGVKHPLPNGRPISQADAVGP